ncbi:MAG TPA: phosphate ABC transporter permease PstA [Chloroflexota bacterium]|nr:phosphate ABC transporter permease PstA [Chloroflexota bacterium]
MNQVQRQVREALFWALCGIGLLLLCLPALAIIASLLKDSWPALSLKLLTATTNQGGLRNAITGTLLLALGVLALAGPVGIGCGIYLAEFASPGSAPWLRFFSEILAGIPSIVVGYVGYLVLVVGLHWGYSLLAGILALSVIVLPYVVKTTEVALRQVPSTLREGADALGLPRSTTLRRVLLPPALPAIVTGLVIALAFSTGETAPLLYTAGFTDQDPTLQLLHRPVGYLTAVVFTDIQLPGAQAHQLAYAAAAITLLLLIALTMAGRAISRRSRRLSERMSV